MATFSFRGMISVVLRCVEPRKNLPPLLLKLNERPPEILDYIGVSFGVTPSLFKFWKKVDFVPVYLRYVLFGNFFYFWFISEKHEK